jgi:DNA primase
MNKVFKDWLNRRHITDKVIEDFGITSVNHFLFNNNECIVIPVVDENGVFIFNKYRRSPLDLSTPKYLYDKGGKVSLYGLDKIKDESTILITEGEVDCLVAWSANIPAVTSTGGALSFQEEWAKYFIDKEVILCFDNDQAGGEGMARALDIIPHAKVLFLPDRGGLKDVSDYVEGGGNLNELLKTAKFLPTLEAVRENRADRVAMFLSTFFHDAYIKTHEKVTRPVSARKERIETDKFLRAKAYPITDLLEFTQGKAKCLWHNERTASLAYYPKTNTCYCFGQCGRVFDSIDVYRKLHNCSFNEAVQALQ